MAFTAKILSWRFRHLSIVGCLLKRRRSEFSSDKWLLKHLSIQERVYLVMVKFYSWGHFVLCNVQLLLCQYMLLASWNPYPIIANSVANYRPHLSHFWKM